MVVGAGAQALPVGGVQEESVVSPVGHYVVHCHCRGNPALLQTLSTQWILLKVELF